jgi:AbrB family looped-hinge helix DNA binding protein
MKTILSEKGQITIPKEIRDELGLIPGTVLDFIALRGKLIATKAMREDVTNKWRGRGKIPRGLSVDAYLRKIREGNA